MAIHEDSDILSRPKVSMMNRPERLTERSGVLTSYLWWDDIHDSLRELE
jgi:hypothetical protein